MFAIAPDTQQNIIYTIYFILIHNFQAILYSLGIIVLILWSLYKPSRAKLIAMIGFILLLFSFEYHKHILEPLREQTLNSLITERESWRIERYVNLILIKIVPLGLPVGGWFLIISAMVLKFSGLEKKINDRIG